MISHSRRSKACDRCRAKKVKCDESTPECLRCQKAGMPCPGPIRGCIFVHKWPRGVRVVQEARESARQTPASPQSREVKTADVPPKSTAASPKTTPAFAKSPSPLSIIGQGRVDPFSAIARRTTVRENFLIDFYVSDIISCYAGNLGAVFHPPRDVCFNTAMQGSAGLEVVLAFAAGHLARMMGQKDTEARIYELSAVRLIGEAIADPSRRFLASTMMAILGSTNLLMELRSTPLSFEVQKQVTAHVQGLRFLINGRGGYVAICNDTSVSWLTVYTDLLVFGALSIGSTPLSAHTLSPGPFLASGLVTGFGPTSRTYSYPLKTLAEEYIGVFHNFFQEAQRRLRSINEVSRVAVDKGCFLISRLFRPHTPIYQLLTTPTTVTVNAPVVVLLLLNVILWDYRHDLLSAFHGYFKRLRLSMVEEGLDLSGTMDRFLWMLFTNPRTYNIDSPDLERLWLVSRLLRIHAMLSKNLQAEGERKLLDFLISEDANQNQFQSQEGFYLEVMSGLGIL